MSALAVVMGAFSLQSLVSPYEVPATDEAGAGTTTAVDMNLVESAGLLISFATLYLGLWTVANSDGGTVDTGVAQYILTFTVLTINAVWAAYIAYQLYQGYHLNDWLRKLLCCCCNSKEKKGEERKEVISESLAIEMSSSISMKVNPLDASARGLQFTDVLNPLGSQTAPKVMKMREGSNSKSKGVKKV
jgi:hypothetical protein